MCVLSCLSESPVCRSPDTFLLFSSFFPGCMKDDYPRNSFTFVSLWNCWLARHMCQLHFVQGPFSCIFLGPIFPPSHRRSNSSRIFFFCGFIIWERLFTCELAPVIFDQLRTSISASDYNLTVFTLLQYCRLCYVKVRATLLLNCNSYRGAIMFYILDTELHNELPCMIVTVTAYMAQTQKIDITQTKKCGAPISAWNKWICMHPLNWIIVSGKWGWWTNLVCNTWRYP